MRRLGQLVLTVGVLMLALGFTLPFLVGVPKNDGIALVLRICGIALALIGLIVRRRGPTASDFPPGTEFFIKEFDVPLALVPGEGWFNWFGGVPRAYDSSSLRVDNNWPAGSFKEWRAVVHASLKRM